MTTWGRKSFEQDGLAIAKGNSLGHSFVHKSGYNPQVDSNTDPETLWTAGGLYPWEQFTTARTVYISSNSLLDNGQVIIDGLDDNFNVIKETLPIVGTQVATSTKAYRRVNALIFVDGSTNNVGTINARVGSSLGVIVSQIYPTFGVSVSATYTVPSGYTAYILVGDFSVQKNEGAQVQFKVRAFGSSFRLSHLSESFQNTYRYDFPIPLPLSEKSDLDVLVYQVETNGTRVSANFDLILVDNSNQNR